MSAPERTALRPAKRRVELDGRGKIPISRIPTGTSSGSVCLGTDARLADARTPLTHSHAISEVTGLQTALNAKQTAGAAQTSIKLSSPNATVFTITVSDLGVLVIT